MAEGVASKARAELEGSRAASVTRAASDRSRLAVRATRLEQALDWAAGLAPSPMRVATSCCGMSLQQGGDAFEFLGTAPPAVSSRSADLLIVAGSITPRLAPLLRDIYDRMLDPRWVIAWGACAISGGPYDNYATISGLGRILPVDLVVPGCPPAPVALREALELLRSGATRDPSRRAISSRPSEDWPIQRPALFEGADLENAPIDGAGPARVTTAAVTKMRDASQQASMDESGAQLGQEGSENVDRG